MWTHSEQWQALVGRGPSSGSRLPGRWHGHPKPIGQALQQTACEDVVPQLLSPRARTRRHGAARLSDLGPPELLAHPMMLNWHEVTLGLNILTSEIISATTNSLSNVPSKQVINRVVFLRNTGTGRVAQPLVPMSSFGKPGVICSSDRWGGGSP